MKHTIPLLLLSMMLTGCYQTDCSDALTVTDYIPDYSAHTDPREADYKTVLGDPSELPEERIIALEVPAAGIPGLRPGRSFIISV